ncbi:phosphotransferase [Arthrobacter sp. NPDC090010]|uniref:phosphotransferase n=1 Tax=Arthrobacter sp. NPDC090010 TaxID=3363942 RepID=UPI00382E2846
MKRSPLELAALASAAVPGLSPTAVRPDIDDPADFDAALLYDKDEKRWRVRAPRHEEASARLESEFAVLHAFTAAVRAELPFRIPTVVGCVRQGPLSTFVYSHVAGQARSLEALERGGEATAREIATALAAIHALPHAVVDRADLPRYDAEEFRQRRLNELDQAATSGRIPADLLRRWEHALEDVTLWNFKAAVVHGELHEDNLLFDDDSRITAVTGWTDLHIGDPADDFAWLVASHDTAFVEAVLQHYLAARGDAAEQDGDAQLLRRAALSAEFALAQYLVKGMSKNDAAMVQEAEQMLHDLASDVQAAETAAREVEEAELEDEPGEESDSAAGAKVTVTALAPAEDEPAEGAITQEDASSVPESRPTDDADSGSADDEVASQDGAPAGNAPTAGDSVKTPGPDAADAASDPVDTPPAATPAGEAEGLSAADDTATTALPVIRHES